MLNQDVLDIVLSYLLPEDKLMLRVCSRLLNTTITPSMILLNDDICVGSLVCFKDRYTRKDFAMWGSDIGRVTDIQRNKVKIISGGRTVYRAQSGVRRIRIFPDVVTVTARNGYISHCPGCHGEHYTDPIDRHRSGSCRISINKAHIDPFPRGYFIKNFY